MPIALTCIRPRRGIWENRSNGWIGLAAWREAPFFTERERAALAWAEAVTCVAETHVPDAAYAEVKKHLSDKELVDLTVAITMINAWNRLSVAFRSEPKERNLDPLDKPARLDARENH